MSMNRNAVFLIFVNILKAIVLSGSPQQGRTVGWIGVTEIY